MADGRLIDHVHIVVRDLNVSRRFYKAALSALGMSIQHDGPDFFSVDEFFVSEITEPGMRHSTIHLAFKATDRDAVARFHKAAIEAGGTDNGAPGERPRYHAGYYGAFVLDPDGNNIEATFHER